MKKQINRGINIENDEGCACGAMEAPVYDNEKELIVSGRNTAVFGGESAASGEKICTEMLKNATID